MTFRINRVYTRSGDDGQTALVGGTRVSKAELRVCSYGELDEANALLGVAKEEITPHCAELRELIEFLQQELFDLGAELATPAAGAPAGDTPAGGTPAGGTLPGATTYPWLVSDGQVENLERLCDRFGENLPELSSFVLPGGSKLAAALHQARTVVRRAERSVVALAGEDSRAVRPQVLKYINRLSDLLFILARWSLAREGREAVLWVQNSNRKVPGL